MPWIMDAQSWKIIWGQFLMSRWAANHANSLRFPVPWKQACVLCFWFSFFWPCFPDLPSASGAVDIWCTGHLLCLADFGRLFDHRNYFIHDNMIPDTTFAKDRFFLQQWSKERPLFQRKNPFRMYEANHFRMFFISVFTGKKFILHAKFFFDETVDCRDGFRRRFFRGKREIRERMTYLLELI